MIEADFLVVGAGIAGASAAAELSMHGRVVVIERESQPGYHSTGRSAALYTEIYGNATIRALTSASGPFFRMPPAGFSEAPLLRPRPMIEIGRADQAEAVETLAAAARKISPDVALLDRDAVLRLAPFVSRDYLACGVLDPYAFDLDVAAIHQGFLKGARGRGAQVLTNAEAVSGVRRGGRWEVGTRIGTIAAPVLVNAAGAWADEFARICGVGGIGLVPKRRTAFLFAFDPPASSDDWPVVGDIDEAFYVKPQSGRMLGSPADETPSPPCDAQPEEIDVAIAIDRIMQATTLNVTRIESKWAGLRSFVPDKSPAVGFDPVAEGFFWLAAQGGYGIQTSPALGRVAAMLATGQSLPPDVLDRGVDASQLAPARLVPVANRSTTAEDCAPAPSHGG